VDASGYSTIVRHNPRDLTARAFDLLRERILSRIATASAEFRCASTRLWSWRGDGGIVAVQDHHESVARDVALTAARDILLLDLEQIRSELRRVHLRGELHLRLAVHKGTIRIPANGKTGTIHSPDVNFAIHLEKVVPPDCVAISEEVHLSAGPHGGYTLVGTYETHNIYLMPATGTPTDARAAWLATVGLSDCHPVFAHPQRPSQQEKARLVSVARTDIVDLGTALHTGARYLGTTERPAHYRDAVLQFLASGGTYRCIVLDPSCESARIVADYCQEDLPAKIRATITALARFKQRHGLIADRLHVYQARVFPGFSAIAIDLNSTAPLILYSPYLMAMKPFDLHLDHADSPHYLATPASGSLHTTLHALLRAVTALDDLDRIL
ncbi:hypothetical protein, partial [Actinophytocola sp.]|uniref:hypothetical protein n=1 Tax=Actinophytocola sp. TaxID=1872138 RepID=UPI002D806185